jgi:hypothetical protein
MTMPALQETHAAERGAASLRSTRLRMMLGLARIEAVRMARSWLVLGGLVAGNAAIWAWYGLGQVQPLWWEADWRIGGGQLFLALTVLVAAQQAAGRPRRDGMTDLYASLPATASIRTLAHLAALAGALPASLLTVGAGTAIVELGHPIGAPNVMVLTGGVVLVIAAGAAGTAIGTRFPHPLAGLLGALALFLPTATVHLLPGWSIWLIPWQLFADQLGWLPGPLPGYPPAAAHAAELAGIGTLAAIVALAMTMRRRRARGWLAAGGVLTVTAIFFAGAVQLEPVPAAALNHLAAESADPGSAQYCTTAHQVRYCLYPGFGRDLPSFEAPVSNVLALLPARPGQPLTVQQDFGVDFTSPDLTYGHSQQQVSQWNAQVRYMPGGSPAASAIYLGVGEWPAAGGSLTDADFNLALAAALWATGLSSNSSLHRNQVCVALDQAREAITIWAAILGARPPAGELQQGLNVSQQQAPVSIPGVTEWSYPGVYTGGIAPPAIGFTAAGYLLAKAMAALPAQKVDERSSRTHRAQSTHHCAFGVIPHHPVPRVLQAWPRSMVTGTKQPRIGKAAPDRARGLLSALGAG